MEFNMLASIKQASITIGVTLALSMPLSPAFSDPAPSNTAMQNQAAPALRGGSLVRLRSAGAAWFCIAVFDGAGRSCATGWQSCSAAFRRAIDDRRRY